MKALYHGSIYDFRDIDLSKGHDYKDFGKGFYATSVPEHADRIAIRNKHIALKRIEHLKRTEKIRHANAVVAYRYQFLFDEQMADNLNCKLFRTADREWLKFVVTNRFSKGPIHSYDIVIGPTADAQTSLILNAWQDELLQSDFAEDICEKVIEELLPENLPKQYFFGTEAAIQTLQSAVVKRQVIG